MRHRPLRLCVALALALAAAHQAHADIAPPEQPPGSTIGPAGATEVQMRAERVVIVVRPGASGPQPGENDVVADVRAEFEMHNAGASDEQMLLRFPLADPGGDGAGFGRFPQVQGFAASVNGTPAPVSRLDLPNPQGGDAPPIAWAAFDAAFPAAGDTAIVTTYTITATGYSPEARFGYVLETGAGWRDAIGSAEVVLRLPYAASAENVFLDRQTTPGATFEGNEVRWRFENLEPTAGDNIFATILAPDAWQRVLAARQRVAEQPSNANAAIDLARAYGRAITSRFPIDQGDPFELLMEEEYERALELAPRAADTRVEYAKVLLNGLAVQALRPADDPYVQRIAAQLAAALAVDPQHEGALQLLEELRASVDGTLELPTAVAQAEPTATPTPAPPPTASPRPEPTTAPLAEPTAGPTSVPTAAPFTAQPAHNGGLPVVPIAAGAALLAALCVLVGVRLGRRRR